MKVAFGMKAHSGWAALVVLGKRDADLVVADRRRIELVEDEWAKQPYHAAESLNPAVAQDLVKRGKEIASLGKSAGPPWGKDQKEAALAALVALNLSISNIYQRIGHYD